MKRHKLFQSGQSLLEIAVVLGITALVISAISISTIIGLKNSQFSENQNQATKLAEEALEKIRSMRENNTPVCTGDGNKSIWSGLVPPLIWDYNFPTDEIYYLTNLAPPNCGLIKLASPPQPESNLQSKFKRKVVIEHYSGDTNQLKFTVLVTWVDSTGPHGSQLTTILSNYK